ncbi:MAG: zf-HC2 domain-containing protein [Myxococcales bacterium]|nr:zf-HC2 domain-containing protein [Myxococcales bacterium]MCB9547826.1 zf-HC2 domain-containing protein [Myxococcales bacterium]
MPGKSTLRCEDVADDLVLLLDGALSAWRAEAVNGHLRGCRRCSRFYSSLRAQLVLHQWAADEAFEFDDADACRPEDLPDFARLSARLQVADMARLGQLLYAILKAEFLHDHGAGLAAQQAPIADPRAERRRGADLVDELRDWHDADQVDGVDLRDVARRIAPRPAEEDRLEALIQGMAVVARLAPELADAARYYQAIAHVKAGRSREAVGLLEAVVAGGSPLVRIARICLATLPAMMENRPDDSIAALEACLAGDATDAIVLFNLAKAHFLQAGGQLTPAVVDHVARARGVDPAMVAAQLGQAGEAGLREALAAADQRTSTRTSSSS